MPRKRRPLGMVRRTRRGPRLPPPRRGRGKEGRRLGVAPVPPPALPTTAPTTEEVAGAKGKGEEGTRVLSRPLPHCQQGKRCHGRRRRRYHPLVQTLRVTFIPPRDGRGPAMPPPPRVARAAEAAMLMMMTMSMQQQQRRRQ